jgi:uracil-DNA glycosylase family 4
MRILTVGKKLSIVKKQVWKCKACGEEYLGKSACGFGRSEEGVDFLVGMNPWVKGGEFSDGRGITILKERMDKWDYENFFFDNVVKCEMPGKFKPNISHFENCRSFFELQLRALNPKRLIVFGAYACKMLVGHFEAWNRDEYVAENFESKQLVMVPHFSSLLYEGEKAVENFYEILKEVLLDEV